MDHGAHGHDAKEGVSVTTTFLFLGHYHIAEMLGAVRAQQRRLCSETGRQSGGEYKT